MNATTTTAATIASPASTAESLETDSTDDTKTSVASRDTLLQQRKESFLKKMLRWCSTNCTGDNLKAATRNLKYMAFECAPGSSAGLLAGCIFFRLPEFGAGAISNTLGGFFIIGVGAATDLYFWRLHRRELQQE